MYPRRAFNARNRFYPARPSLLWIIHAGPTSPRVSTRSLQFFPDGGGGGGEKSCTPWSVALRKIKLYPIPWCTYGTIHHLLLPDSSFFQPRTYPAYIYFSPRRRRRGIVASPKLLPFFLPSLARVFNFRATLWTMWNVIFRLQINKVATIRPFHSITKRSNVIPLYWKIHDSLTTPGRKNQRSLRRCKKKREKERPNDLVDTVKRGVAPKIKLAISTPIYIHTQSNAEGYAGYRLFVDRPKPCLFRLVGLEE